MIPQEMVPTEPVSGSFGQLSWTITPVASENILLTRTNGPIDAVVFPHFVRAMNAAAEALGCNNYLMDHRQSDFVMSVLDIYFNPDSLHTLKIPSKCRAAVVFSKPSDLTKFLDLRLQNTCAPSKVFYDLDEAHKWLLSMSRQQQS